MTGAETSRTPLSSVASLVLASVASLVLASVALCFVVVPWPASAQGGTAEGFYFGPAYVGTGIDTGISSQGVSPFRGQVISIVPTTISYTPRLRTSSFSLEYEPRVEVYTTMSELNALNHLARGRYSGELTRNLTLQIDGNFLRSKDRSLQTQNLLLTPRGQFMSGILSVGTTYQLNIRTSLTFRVMENYTESPTVFTTELLSVKQLATTAFAGVTRNFGISQSLTASYVYQTSSTLNSDEIFDATGQLRTGGISQDTVNASYSYNTRSELYLQGSAGIIHRRQGFGLGEEWSYSLGGTIRKAWRSVATSGGYRRTLGGFLIFAGLDPTGQPIDPLLETRVAQRVDFSLRANAGRRVQLAHTLGYTRTDFAGSPLEFLNADVTASVRAGDRFAPFVSFLFLEQRVPDAPSLRRARILLGLRFFWEPTPIGAPLNGGNAAAPRGR